MLIPQVLDAPARGDAVATPGDRHGAPAASPAPSAAEGKSTGAAPPDFSQTNVQEAGVDEPDIVKTDGRTVFAIAGGKLHAIDVSGARRSSSERSISTARYGHQLLIRGNRLLVMSNSYGGDGDRRRRRHRGVAGRAQRGRHQRPGGDEGAPHDDDGGRARRRAPDRRHRARRRRRLAGLHPPGRDRERAMRRFVPRTVLRSNVSGRTFRRSVVACDDVRHPRRFSGLDLLTVLTIDLDKGLFDVDRDAIMAGAQTVYASTTGLYVACQRYVAALEAGPRGARSRSRTEIHRFDTSKPDETTYASSGSVRGLRAQPVLDVGVRRRAARRVDRGAGLVRRASAAATASPT